MHVYLRPYVVLWSLKRSHLILDIYAYISARRTGVRVAILGDIWQWRVLSENGRIHINYHGRTLSDPITHTSQQNT